MQAELLAEPETHAPEPATPPAVTAYTLAEHKTFHAAVLRGEVNAEQLKAKFARAVASRDSLRHELNAKTLKELAPGGTRGTTKARIIDQIIDQMLGRFHVSSDSIMWSPFGETYQDAVARQVNAQTDQDIQAFIAKSKERVAELEKALNNPETLSEFERFISYKGADKLTPEQSRKLDELRADRERERRGRYEDKSTIDRVENMGDVAFSIVEGTHTKRNCPIWTVQLSARVSAGKFKELTSKANALGGYYSSWRGAAQGFIFFSKEHADKFASLKDESADRSDILEDREALRKLVTAERFRTIADRIQARAEEKLNADRKTNTARRANIANSIEAGCRAELETANILRNLAAASDRGELKFLADVWARAQIDTLRLLLRRAMYRTMQKQNESGEGRAVRFEDIDNAEFPWPHVSLSTILKLWNELRSKPGCKLLCGRVARWVNQYRRSNRDAEWVKFQSTIAIVDWLELINKAKEHGFNKWDCQQMADNAHHYKQLAAMNIRTSVELRAALRELMQFRGQPVEADPVTKALRNLSGVPLPGYFPTPPDVIERMLEKLDLQADFEGTILEPSAGAGHIADALAERWPKAEVQCFEIRHSLADILKLKGHTVTCCDFTALTERLAPAAVVMNPPFEDYQDIDHVRAAFEHLAPGGRLVAIMSEGAFFHTTTKAKEFRAWLDAIGGVNEKLPAGSFLNSDRPTGVNTRLVWISK